MIIDQRFPRVRGDEFPHLFFSCASISRFPRVRGDEPSRSVLSKVHGLVFPTGVGIDRPQRRQTGCQFTCDNVPGV